MPLKIHASEPTHLYSSNLHSDDRPADPSHALLTTVQAAITSPRDRRSLHQQSAYPHVLGSGALELGPLKEELASALRGNTYFAPDHRGQNRGCAKLTTSRAAYQDLLSGSNAASAEYLRGHTARPVQAHELPYGSECPMLIGDRVSIYRQNFCGVLPSPRTVRLQASADDAPAPPSPRRSTGHQVDGKPEYSRYEAVTTYGSTRAEQAVDVQARRELGLLRNSARAVDRQCTGKRQVLEAIVARPPAPPRHAPDAEAPARPADGPSDASCALPPIPSSPRGAVTSTIVGGEEYLSVPRSFFSNNLVTSVRHNAPSSPRKAL